MLLQKRNVIPSNLAKMDDFENLCSELDRALEIDYVKDKYFELTTPAEIASHFNNNIYGVLEDLRLKLQETDAIRSDVKSEKERVKLNKSTLENKMVQLKGEINQLIEANRQMKEQIGQKNIPLILKLMGSLS